MPEFSLILGDILDVGQPVGTRQMLVKMNVGGVSSPLNFPRML